MANPSRSTWTFAAGSIAGAVVVLAAYLGFIHPKAADEPPTAAAAPEQPLAPTQVM